MSREATCVRCQHVLHVSPDAQSLWLTCPRCLASVGNPNRVLPAEPPTTAVTSAPAPWAIPQGLSCPWCDYKVEATWRVCPHCGRTLAREGPKSSRASLDAEVRRDSRGVNVVALVLGVLLMVGAVLFVAVGGPMAVQSSKDGAAVVGVGILALGAFVGGLIAMAVGARNRAVTVVSGVVGGVVLGVGAVLLVVLLLCMSIVAAFANICGGGRH